MSWLTDWFKKFRDHIQADNDRTYRLSVEELTETQGLPEFESWYEDIIALIEYQADTLTQHTRILSDYVTQLIELEGELEECIGDYGEITDGLQRLVRAVDYHEERTVAENAADWELYEVADQVRALLPEDESEEDE